MSHVQPPTPPPTPPYTPLRTPPRTKLRITPPQHDTPPPGNAPPPTPRASRSKQSVRSFPPTPQEPEPLDAASKRAARRRRMRERRDAAIADGVMEPKSPVSDSAAGKSIRDRQIEQLDDLPKRASMAMRVPAAPSTPPPKHSLLPPPDSPNDYRHFRRVPLVRKRRPDEKVETPLVKANSTTEDTASVPAVPESSPPRIERKLTAIDVMTPASQVGVPEVGGTHGGTGCGCGGEGSGRGRCAIL